MSTNIHFVATREIFVPSTKKKDIQDVYFGAVWQTPTADTLIISESSDPVQAYKEWVIGCKNIHSVAVYADGDIFCDGDPIGTQEVDYGKEHIEVFDAWIKDHEERGYQIQCEAW